MARDGGAISAAAEPAVARGPSRQGLEGRWGLWILAGVAVVGAILRFATLDLQSYSHEEAVTAARVLHPGLFDTLSTIPDSESTPPLYYVVAWLWSVPLGTGEIALRSLSALAGTATIPVAFLIGRELASRRVGLVAAGLVAASPMLVSYSQLARSYSLLVLLSGLSFLLMVRALRDDNRALVGWAAASALALATHYFAAFLIAPEAALVLYRLRSGSALLAAGAVAAAGAALLPLAIHQADIPNNDWVSNEPLGTRLLDVPRKFLVGETGAYISIYGRGSQSTYLDRALLPGAVAVAGLVLLWLRGDGRERGGARLALLIAIPALLLPALLALVGPDYLLARNLLPAYLPLAAVVACGLGARRAGWAGPGLAAALCSILAAFAIYTMARPSLRHDDWRAVAESLDPAQGTRLLIVPFLGDDPLSYYLGDGVHRNNRFSGPVSEVTTVGYGAPAGRAAIPAAFSRRGQQRVSYFTVTRFRAPQPIRVRADALARSSLVGSRKAAVLVETPGG